MRFQFQALYTSSQSLNIKHLGREGPAYIYAIIPDIYVFLYAIESMYFFLNNYLFNNIVIKKIDFINFFI